MTKNEKWAHSADSLQAYSKFIELLIVS